MREAVAVMERSLHDPDAYIEAGTLILSFGMGGKRGNPIVLAGSIRS